MDLSRLFILLASGAGLGLDGAGLFRTAVAEVDLEIGVGGVACGVSDGEASGAAFIVLRRGVDGAAAGWYAPFAVEVEGSTGDVGCTAADDGDEVTTLGLKRDTWWRIITGVILVTIIWFWYTVDIGVGHRIGSLGDFNLDFVFLRSAGGS